jgi:hypothetical protein
MSAHARPSHVEDALRAGAHQVLYRRLDWLLNDDRPYESRPAGPFGTPMHREEPKLAEPAHAGAPAAPTRAARS